MSEDKKRPLDTEKVTDAEMMGVAGGTNEPDNDNESGNGKIALNTAYINVSDKD